MADLVCVKVFSSRLEAEFAKGLLETNKVPSLIRADDEGGMMPSLTGPQGVRLYVSEKDQQKAEKILEGK